MQIFREDVYISNKFPTMSYVFLYVKSRNFPPNGQISREGASQIPHFFPPWLVYLFEGAKETNQNKPD